MTWHIPHMSECIQRFCNHSTTPSIGRDRCLHAAIGCQHRRTTRTRAAKAPTHKHWLQKMNKVMRRCMSNAQKKVRRRCMIKVRRRYMSNAQMQGERRRGLPAARLRFGVGKEVVLVCFRRFWVLRYYNSLTRLGLFPSSLLEWTHAFVLLPGGNPKLLNTKHYGESEGNKCWARTSRRGRGKEEGKDRKGALRASHRLCRCGLWRCESSR